MRVSRWFQPKPVRALRQAQGERLQAQSERLEVQAPLVLACGERPKVQALLVLACGERPEVQAPLMMARGERIERVRRSLPFGLSLSKPVFALRQAQGERLQAQSGRLEVQALVVLACGERPEVQTPLMLARGERLEVQAPLMMARGERIERVRRSLPFGLSLSKPVFALRQAQGERLQAQSERLKVQTQQMLARGQRMQFRGGRFVHPLDQATGACR